MTTGAAKKLHKKLEELKYVWLSTKKPNHATSFLSSFHNSLCCGGNSAPQETPGQIQPRQCLAAALQVHQGSMGGGGGGLPLCSRLTIVQSSN